MCILYYTDNFYFKKDIKHPSHILYINFLEHHFNINGSNRL